MNATPPCLCGVCLACLAAECLRLKTQLEKAERLSAAQAAELRALRKQLRLELTRNWEVPRTT